VNFSFPSHFKRLGTFWPNLNVWKPIYLVNFSSHYEDIRLFQFCTQGTAIMETWVRICAHSNCRARGIFNSWVTQIMIFIATKVARIVNLLQEVGNCIGQNRTILTERCSCELRRTARCLRKNDQIILSVIDSVLRQMKVKDMNYRFHLVSVPFTLFSIRFF